jgi:hypothetical protein
MPMLESITKHNIRYFDSYLFIGNNSMLYLASRFISYKASGYLKKNIVLLYLLFRQRNYMISVKSINFSQCIGITHY